MLQIPRNDVLRVLRATRQVERQMRNPRGHRGRWVPHGRRSTILLWFMLKKSLAPGGTAEAYRCDIDEDGETSVNRRVFLDLAINTTDYTYVSSVDNPFSGSDIGTKLIIISGTGFYLNPIDLVSEYIISDVVTHSYTDLVTVATNRVSSASHPFTGFDVGLTLTIEETEGFVAGDYVISSVNESNEATLSGYSGTIDSTGGKGSITPSAKVSGVYGIVGDKGSTGGHGYSFPTLTVVDTQGKYRSIGGDDYIAEKHHLTIDSEDATIVWCNDGYETDNLPFGAGAFLFIESGAGFTPGHYLILDCVYNEVAERWEATLDREAGTLESVHGVCYFTALTGAIGCGKAITSTTTAIVAIQEMSQRCRIITTDGFAPSEDTEIYFGSIRGMDGGQQPTVDFVIARHPDIYVREGKTDTVACAERPFLSADAGKAIWLYGCDNGVMSGWYMIDSVDAGKATFTRDCVWVFDDFLIPEGYTDRVSSALFLSVVDGDATGGFVTIVSGNGFSAATYEITDVSGNYLILDGTVGTAGSVCGRGYVTGLVAGDAYTKVPITLLNDGKAAPPNTYIDAVWDEYVTAFRPRPSRMDVVKYGKCGADLASDSPGGIVMLDQSGNLLLQPLMPGYTQIDTVCANAKVRAVYDDGNWRPDLAESSE